MNNPNLNRMIQITVKEDIMSEQVVSAFFKRVCFFCLFFAFVFLPSAGCSHFSHFQFASHDSFDQWYAEEHPFDVNRLSVGVEDGNFAAYVLNDILLRTPAYAVHDMTKMAVAPITAPYYGARRVFKGE